MFLSVNVKRLRRMQVQRLCTLEDFFKFNTISTIFSSDFFYLIYRVDLYIIVISKEDEDREGRRSLV